MEFNLLGTARMKSPQTVFKESLAPIFYCCIVLSGSWAMLVFFYDIPSLILKFTAWEVASYAAYTLLLSSVESVITALCITALVSILPIRHIREDGLSAGILFAVSAAVIGIYFAKFPEVNNWLVNIFHVSIQTGYQITGGLGAFVMLAGPVLSIILSKDQKIRSYIASFSENLYILSRLYIVLAVISLSIILYRNLFIS